MTREKITFVPANIAITAERPVTDEAVMKGLMFRTSLGEKEGMIFYFTTTDRHAFWMFNTKIPLEILFLDEKLTIVDIQEMEPCRERDSAACFHYVTKKPARYAIEVNRDFSKRHGIHIGDKVRIDR